MAYRPKIMEKLEAAVSEKYYSGMNVFDVFDNCNEHHHVQEQQEDGVVNIEAVRKSLELQRKMLKARDQMETPMTGGLSPKDRYLHKRFQDVKEQKRKKEKMIK